MFMETGKGSFNCIQKDFKITEITSIWYWWLQFPILDHRIYSQTQHPFCLDYFLWAVMTSNEAAKNPGGTPENAHFRALRPDPAAASFTLWKPLAAGFTSRKRKWNMLHFHGHQSADAVPGKLHNYADIANWHYKKYSFQERNTEGRKTTNKQTKSQSQSILACMGQWFLSYWEGWGLRLGSTSTFRGSSTHPSTQGQRWEQESAPLQVSLTPD